MHLTFPTSGNFYILFLYSTIAIIITNHSFPFVHREGYRSVPLKNKNGGVYEKASLFVQVKWL